MDENNKNKYIAVSCSEDLIQTPEELHATSLGGPSGFRLAWDEMVAEDEDG